MAIDKRDANDADLLLRSLTEARVRLGRFGAGLPTRAAQSFLLDHARAREAVWSAMAGERIALELAQFGLPILSVQSAAGDRPTYIRRPDLGRVLAETSSELLAGYRTGQAVAPDLAIVIGDGLSATAVDINAVPVMTALVPELQRLGLTLGPVVLASHARVALGDPIATLLGAKTVIVLIGERPGLSASDSLGAYVTYDPAPGTADSSRNCISNIREGGLAAEAAARALAALVVEMRVQQVSGVRLQRSLPEELQPLAAISGSQAQD